MNIVQAIKRVKRTENGDISFTTTGNKYLDILFQTEYFTKHLDETPRLNDNEYDKLFSMFIRDPRFGIGKRDLGRVLMADTNLSPEKIVLAGRFDDLLANATDENISYLINEVKNRIHSYLYICHLKINQILDENNIYKNNYDPKNSVIVKWMENLYD